MLSEIAYREAFYFGELFVYYDSMDFIRADLLDGSKLIIKSQKFIHYETISLKNTKDSSQLQI